MVPSIVDDANFITIELGEEDLGAIEADQQENNNEGENRIINMQPVVILNDIKNSPSDTKVQEEIIVVNLRKIWVL